MDKPDRELTLFQGVSSPFDAVLMLTWSNWHTEPRSNRYHYATRFARLAPVYFVQPLAEPGAPLRCSSSNIPNLELVETGKALNSEEADSLLQLLHDRGVRRPLIWVYNAVDFQQVLAKLPGNFVAFHATEDYFTDSTAMRVWRIEEIRQVVCSLLPKLDLLVSVSEGVEAALASNAGLPAHHVIASNGCDAGFYEQFSREQNAPQRRGYRAIYQGAINDRLDYGLLKGLAEAMPEWEFVFCGAASDVPGWQSLSKYKNVVPLGNLPPERVAVEMAKADVGVIPFKQDDWIRNSLPLKAYEYVACGLPVVSVPIDALKSGGEAFAFACDISSFKAALERLAPARWDPEQLRLRRKIARANSYDTRFREVCSAIHLSLQQRLRSAATVGVLTSRSPSLLQWQSLVSKQGRFNTFVLHCTETLTHDAGSACGLDFFDVLVIDAAAVSQWVSAVTTSWLKNYRGRRIMLLQQSDEPSVRDTRLIALLQPDWLICSQQLSAEDLPPSWLVNGNQIMRIESGPDFLERLGQLLETLPILPQSQRNWKIGIMQSNSNGLVQQMLPNGVGCTMAVLSMPPKQLPPDTITPGSATTMLRPPAASLIPVLKATTRSLLWKLLRTVKNSELLTLLALNVWSRLPSNARNAILKLMQRR